jgi:hypothetical protein
MNYVRNELAQFDLARSVLARVTKALSCESIPLSMALGRVAAEDIVAEEDISGEDCQFACFRAIRRQPLSASKSLFVLRFCGWQGETKSNCPRCGQL